MNMSANFGMTNELRGVEKKSGESISTFSASVPRPAFEYIKLGTMILNSKLKNNRVNHTDNKHIILIHTVNSI